MSNGQQSLEEQFSNLNNTADITNQFDPQDISQNKVMAVLAYFGILVLIPIFAAKESKFARFHSNQGLILLILGIALSIISSFLSTILFSISYKLMWIMGIISFAIWVIIAVFFILGVINAAKGRAKELPLIGHFKLLKV
ncbi:MAG: zinc ribbon domain-containing protein [Prevotella sp.]|nr:zinc ribbon domain-containing protein [Prevotella sp.]